VLKIDLWVVFDGFQLKVVLVERGVCLKLWCGEGEDGG